MRGAPSPRPQGAPRPLTEQARTLMEREDDVRHLAHQAAREYGLGLAFAFGLPLPLTIGLLVALLLGFWGLDVFGPILDLLETISPYLAAVALLAFTLAVYFAIGLLLVRFAVRMRRRAYGAVTWAAHAAWKGQQYTTGEARRLAHEARHRLYKHSPLGHRRPFVIAFIVGAFLPWPVGSALLVGVFLWWMRQDRMPLPVYAVMMAEQFSDVAAARTRARDLVRRARIMERDLRVSNAPHAARILVPYVVLEAVFVGVWGLMWWLAWSPAHIISYLLTLHILHAVAIGLWFVSVARGSVVCIVEDAIAYEHMVAFEKDLARRLER